MRAQSAAGTAAAAAAQAAAERRAAERRAGEEEPRPGSLFYLRVIGRASGGALIFALPMLMTMEMWQLGYYMEPWRFFLLTALLIPLLVGVSHYAGGFEETFEWREDLRHACVAYAIGATLSAAILYVLAVIDWGMPWDEIVGKVALQAMPASIGALLARSQLGDRSARGEEEREKPREEGYAGELMLMGVGALFLGLNVAPTEEMILIAYKMTPWHAIALVLVSILVMHGFVYALEFSGSAELPPGTPWWSAFLRFTVPGYALALLISFYLLWSFGRTDATDLVEILMTTIVLGFPAAIGAAGARLIL
jgi:putative integral membrane protein (TIGR02587 family)